MLAAPKLPRSRSAALIGGLLVAILAAIAMALPPSPIAREADVANVGALYGTSEFSDGLAEQIARTGFGYMALDLTSAGPERDAFWRTQLEVVAARRFPVWGWVDLSRNGDAAMKLIGELKLSGVFLYGEGAEDRAIALRAARPHLPVVVVRKSGTGDKKSDAIALDLESYLNSSKGEYARPVLIADQLSAADVMEALDHARAIAVDGAPALLIARVPLLP